MTNEAPSLETYEEMVGVEFDLSDEDVDRAAIDRELEDLFTS